MIDVSNMTRHFFYLYVRVQLGVLLLYTVGVLCYDKIKDLQFAELEFTSSVSAKRQVILQDTIKYIV